ncbi:hypothetical protein FSARC_2487 [Fusarium sarcochroum]|uniref:2EXR domain-containing protein n=1 Tax=Fusarium sarcochroum TaxID=1208366 RepID=A0A8H4U619_9HYPO|nr:hypothetical protein FSARC_2487 [Fusarium sarcochroum]
MPRFSDLPPELRHDLWQTTLPEITDAIYMFNGDWAEQFFPPRANQVRVSPRPCLPARIQVPIPEAYMVCREARAVVEREWTTFWGFCVDSGDFDSMRRLRKNLVNVAIPAYTAFDSIGELADLVEVAPKIKKIFFIWNDLPQPHKIQYRADNQDCEADAPVQPRWEIASFPKLGETVHMHRLDFNMMEDSWEKGVLRDWVMEMDRVWRAVTANTDLVDEHTGELKVPRVNATVMEMPTWNVLV